ncbi:ankyrin repeat-containing domain protein [Powellomyces hirtus]|nr:ankyrin repeat-containing domain protein [Powellomyces hirtus]
MPACTALSAASFNGNLENVQVLLEYNAAVTPGALIASARSRCQDIFDYLLAHVESRETLDNALLSCTNEATGVAVRMFLEAGIGLNKVSMALSSAVEYGCTENARILLQYGADPTHMHNLPLRKAAGYGNVEMVRVLLEAGAYVNGTERTRMVWEEHHFDRCTRDVYGLPLVRAIAIGRYEVAKLLIEWEADVCWQESYALYAAVKCDEYYLYQWDSNRSLKQQVSEKRLRLLRLLVDAGARVDSFGGTRALAAAAESPTPDKRIIRFLLEQQADLATARRKSCKAFEALSDESLVAMRIGYKRKDKLTPPKASTKSTTKSTTKKSTIRSTTDPTQSAPAARKKSASKKRSR